jgi:aryl carrier-like protein
LPLSPAGKIDRRALAQLPVRLESPQDEPRAVALDPVQRLLASLWADALDLDRVAVDDDFFAAGGNSLKAMALTHELQRRLGRPFRPQTLLRAPTVAQFAAYIEETYPDLPALVASGTIGEPAAAAAGFEEGDI